MVVLSFSNLSTGLSARIGGLVIVWALVRLHSFHWYKSLCGMVLPTVLLNWCYCIQDEELLQVFTSFKHFAALYWNGKYNIVQLICICIHYWGNDLLSNNCLARKMQVLQIFCLQDLQDLALYLACILQSCTKNEALLKEI